MIAGPAATADRVFETIQFNDQHAIFNPITGEPLAPTYFRTTAAGFSATEGEALPGLDLPRAFVLTGEGTCSASEAIINSLRGIDVQVVQIGAPTCGKPYGFYPFDNCGTTYFSIQFKGINDKGFGDYIDGFSPALVDSDEDTVIGCNVLDDFAHPLGNSSEARLAAALHYIDTGACPPSVAPSRALQSAGTQHVLVQKSVYLENRIMGAQSNR